MVPERPPYDGFAIRANGRRTRWEPGAVARSRTTTPPTGILRDTLQGALDETGYLELPEGANAVAAVAVVATAIDGDAAGLSEEVVAYIGRTGRPDPALVDLALRALERVGKDGELAELWDETDDPSWRAGMASLHDRLRG
jgi:hypothetical protein